MNRLPKWSSSSFTPSVNVTTAQSVSHLALGKGNGEDLACGEVETGRNGGWGRDRGGGGGEVP